MILSVSGHIELNPGPIFGDFNKAKGLLCEENLIICTERKNICFLTSDADVEGKGKTKKQSENTLRMFPLLNERSLSKILNTESKRMEWNRWNI